MIGRCNICGIENIEVHTIVNKNFSGNMNNNDCFVCDRCHGLLINREHGQILDLILKKLGGFYDTADIS